jgi:PhnB protein
VNAQTYLFFEGQCEEAIEFYQAVFGAELAFLMRYSDAPKNLVPDGGEAKVFHATVTFGETSINMSDYTAGEGGGFGGFALLVHFETIEEAEKAFGRLQVNGHVKVPLAEAPWATRYGIIKDRFGVTWKLQVN